MEGHSAPPVDLLPVLTVGVVVGQAGARRGDGLGATGNELLDRLLAGGSRRADSLLVVGGLLTGSLGDGALLTRGVAGPIGVVPGRPRPCPTGSDPRQWAAKIADK